MTRTKEQEAEIRKLEHENEVLRAEFPILKKAVKHTMTYIDKGTNKTFVCSKGCEHNEYETRLRGVAVAAAERSPMSTLGEVIKALAHSEDVGRKELAAALLNTLLHLGWAVTEAQAEVLADAQAQAQAGPQLVN